MNETPDPREQLHARVTAWLLGELPLDEAAAMAERVRHDKELARLANQLRPTIQLLRAASATAPGDAETPALAEPMQLAAERREKLLSHFKTVPLPQAKVVAVESAPHKNYWGRAIVFAAAAAACLLITASLFLPPLAKAKAKSSRIAEIQRERQRELEERIAEMDREAAPPAKPRLANIVLPNNDAEADFIPQLQVAPTGGPATPNAEFNTAGDRLETRVYSVESKGFVDTSLIMSGSYFDQQQLGGMGGGGGIINQRETKPSESESGAAERFGRPIGTTIAGTPLHAVTPPTPADRFDDSSCSGGGTSEAPRPATAAPARPQRADAELQGRGLAASSPAPAQPRTAPGTPVPEPELGQLAQMSDKRGQQAVRDFDGSSTITVQSADGYAITGAPINSPAVGVEWAGKATSDQSGDRPGFIADNQQDGIPQMNYAFIPAPAKEEDKRRLWEMEKQRATTERLRDTLSMAITQRTADSDAAGVQIISQATAASSGGESLFNRISVAFGGGVERSARVAVVQQQADISTLGRPQIYNGFDPYFVTTEESLIESKSVLYPVIERLKLREMGSDGRSVSQGVVYDRLRDNIEVVKQPDSNQIEIRAKGRTPEEAARIANTVAEVYREVSSKRATELKEVATASLREALAEEEKQLAGLTAEINDLKRKADKDVEPSTPRKPAGPAPVPQPEVLAADNAFSTFSLNVSDVSFKLAAASLAQGQLPEASSIRSEEFLNALNYRDPEPTVGAPLAFIWERARDPFAHNRDLLRFSVKTAALGRQAGIPLNLVLLLDNSGSMERADRVRIVREALRVLAGQLQPQDKLSVITFARTPRLWVDGVSGAQAGNIAERVGGLTPQGGTNLEEALRLAYATAKRHYLAGGNNHVVLLTDGAANLGDVDPASLDKIVETHRKQGIALDCFGIGWEGYNDDLLETLARHGDGRYGFINSPAEAGTEFAAQLAGALQVAASDVKVQVEFNPARVTSWRQIGYAKHQLTKEQFRDNTVDAAEIAAREAGNALYAVEVNPAGDGPLATVRARFRVPGTRDYREHEWDVPFNGVASLMDRASATMRLAAAAAAFAESLAASPFAAEVTGDRLLELLRGVPDEFGADPRPKQMEEMIRQAKAISGR